MMWFLNVAAWWTLAWLGLIGDVDGAGRVLLFWINFGFIASVMSWIVPNTVTKKRGAFFRFLWISENVLSIGFLVWHGWWWSAIATLITAMTFHPKKNEVGP